MNPENIQTIIDFLSKYYIWEIVIMLIALGLTMLIKLPIKNKAVKLEEKYGVDKSILTWTIAFIPYVLTAIMVFVLYWYKSNWALKFDSLEWSQMISEIGIIGSGAIGIYEAVKKIIQGSKAIAEKKNQTKATVKAQPKKIEAKKAVVKKSSFRVEEKEKK